MKTDESHRIEGLRSRSFIIKLFISSRIRREDDMNKEIFFCVCDANNVVVEQSLSCQKLCGKQMGKVCLDGCRQHLKFKKDERGTILLKNRTVHDMNFDILRYQQGNQQVIILIDREIEVSKIDNLRGLTVKEKEVAQLIVKGYSNQEILLELNILKSTLKTHINRIYQKLDGSFQKYRSPIKN